MTYHYSPEGANYHNEGKPPREPTRDLPDLTDAEKQERMDSFNDLGYHNTLKPLAISREQIKDAEIERLNKVIEVMQEQSQHYIGEAEASADHWRKVAAFYMERAYEWEQSYDELFAALNLKDTDLEVGGLPVKTSEQLDRTRAFILANVDTGLQA